MSNDVYNIKWNNFNANQNQMLKHLLTLNNYTDVTLVSDDQFVFQAHKFVIGSCSPILKDLILNNPHPNPTVYLRGINSLELNSILQFIYLGTAQFYQNRVESLFENGRELQIKLLSQPLILNNETRTNCNSGDKSTTADYETGVTNGGSEVSDDANITDEINRYSDIPLIHQLDESIRKSYNCEECAAVFNSKKGLYFHKQTDSYVIQML